MEVEHDKNVDRILFPVTAAIYRNGMEKPAMRLSYIYMKWQLVSKETKTCKDLLNEREEVLESLIGAWN